MEIKKYVLYISNETCFKSIISDFFTWFFPTVCFYINYNFIGNNQWFNCLLFIGFFVVATGAFTHKDVDLDEARKIIDDNEKIH